jgi:nitrilase
MGMAEGDKVKVREADGHGPIQEFLAATAKQHGIWLIGGSIPLEAKDAAKVMNSTVVYDPAGQRVARYDKIHLFGFQKGLERYDEAASIEAGSEPVAFDTPYGRIGLSICYDLRFPELYRRLAPVDLIVVPAAFTETTGRAHWEILLRARAIENQCYVLAVGQGGKHENGRETHGNSMIVDPWGTIVDRKLKGPGVVLGLLDHGCIAETRANLPALKHRVL